MNEHYYTQQPTVKHQQRILNVVLRSRELSFVVDSGVFSKKTIDYGSRFLIETMNFATDAKVLDVGCGYGPIGLSAALLCPNGHVTMLDINERAVELSKINAVRNKINHVTVLQSDTLNKVDDQYFDAILTNPPIRAGKEIIYRIFTQSLERLNVGGSFWTVIQNKQGAQSAKAKIQSIFHSIEVVDKSKGYIVMKATKN